MHPPATLAILLIPLTWGSWRHPCSVRTPLPCAATGSPGPRSPSLFTPSPALCPQAFRGTEIDRAAAAWCCRAGASGRHRCGERGVSAARASRDKRLKSTIHGNYEIVVRAPWGRACAAVRACGLPVPRRARQAAIADSPKTEFPYFFQCNSRDAACALGTTQHACRVEEIKTVS